MQLHRQPLTRCIHTGKRVLDLACGEGRYSRLIKERGGPSSRVVALDLSDEMIQLAEEDETQQHADTRIEYAQVCKSVSTFTTNFDLNGRFFNRIQY